MVGNSCSFFFFSTASRHQNGAEHCLTRTESNVEAFKRDPASGSFAAPISHDTTCENTFHRCLQSDFGKHVLVFTCSHAFARHSGSYSRSYTQIPSSNAPEFDYVNNFLNKTAHVSRHSTQITHNIPGNTLPKEFGCQDILFCHIHSFVRHSGSHSRFDTQYSNTHAHVACHFIQIHNKQSLFSTC